MLSLNVNLNFLMEAVDMTTNFCSAKMLFGVGTIIFAKGKMSVNGKKQFNEDLQSFWRKKLFMILSAG